MEKVKISICGNQAAVDKTHFITSGTAGLLVEFTFDDQWDGLSKTAVFKAGNTVRDKVSVEKQTTVPSEVLSKAKKQLEIGVYGTNENGTVVLPTAWVSVGQILPGADPSGDESTDPTLPVWEQVQKNTIKCIPQPLTPAEQAQARQNIGIDDPSPDYSAYFDIDVDGLVSLKPEYRGASTDYFVNTGKYTFSLSDRGLDEVGSKNSELPERLVIPHNVNGERVTGFQKGMFCCNHRVKEVVLPSGIKAIPGGMFREAIHLEKVENTEQVETVAAGAFQNTRIEEIRFPNVLTIGNNSFSNCSCLRVIDLGKVTAIGTKVFEYCENLIEVLGGENVTTIGTNSFFATRRLKKLSFLDKVTQIGPFAFYHSACDFEEAYDTLVANKCTFGPAPDGKIPNSDRYYTLKDVAPTYKHFNDTDYWSGVTPTPCRTPLNSVFHQRNPEWADEVFGTYKDTDASGNTIDLDLTYRSNGCALLSLATIYSAFEDVEFSHPREFMDILRSKGLTDAEKHNPRYRPQWCAIAEGLGYTTEYISDMTQANYRKVCEALAEGALLYKSVGTLKTVGSTAWTQPEGGHATVVYGINSAGEMLMSDTSMHCDDVGIYENHKTAWHIYKHGSKECDVVIVRKKGE